MARPLVDFGVSAGDYAQHRPGFPNPFFDHVRRYGIGVAGQCVLDIGTGTGALARGFAQRGCRAVGVDPSPEMLHEAVALTRAAGLCADYVRGQAEATGLVAGRFDLVCAGQCWHWFDRAAAAGETWRVLRPGGHALIAYFSYLSEPGTLGAITEQLVLRHNPAWPLAGSDGRAPGLITDLTSQGFEHIATFEFDMPIRFTHDSWRGRLRACNGVMTLPQEQLAAFDAELAALLAERYPEPLLIPHRIYAIVGRKPATASA